MKKLSVIILLLIIPCYLFGQESQPIKNRSKKKYIIYSKDTESKVISELPDLRIIDISFIDNNNNSVLEGGEQGEIKLLLKNNGPGNAKEVSVDILAPDAEKAGIIIDNNITIGEILPDNYKEIRIPVEAESDISDRNYLLELLAIDENGFKSKTADLTIKLSSRLKPDLRVASAIFGEDAGELFQQNFPIKLSIRVKNFGTGIAEKATVKFLLPNDNCVMLGETNTYFIDKLDPGNIQEFLYIFTATSRYTTDTIPVKVSLSEKHNEYGHDTILVADLAPKSPDIVKPLDDVLNLKGKYYALIMGVNEYDDEYITDLDRPLKDAEKVYDILTDFYTFEEENVRYLKNPTRGDIISAMDELEREITENDNLFIFFAGHGFWDERSDKGYWLPSDANRSNTVNWIRNTSISDYMASIKSRHTLLVADACFSGGIFKTRRAFSMPDMAVKRLYDLPSRKAMTSGTLKEVPDKSVFVEYFVKRLEENLKKYLPSEQLFFSFKPAVLNNSDNVPQFGIIKNAGDEGGDFIFIRR
ncbi:MAG: caspase family protein [Bacteroidales bacterium]|nr:MAG: caspase family protein [Bacteroidales bacterium]